MAYYTNWESSIAEEVELTLRCVLNGRQNWNKTSSVHQSSKLQSSATAELCSTDCQTSCALEVKAAGIQLTPAQLGEAGSTLGFKTVTLQQLVVQGENSVDWTEVEFALESRLYYNNTANSASPGDMSGSSSFSSSLLSSSSCASCASAEV
jgi:hypothetical protein